MQDYAGMRKGSTAEEVVRATRLNASISGHMVINHDLLVSDLGLVHLRRPLKRSNGPYKGLLPGDYGYRQSDRATAGHHAVEFPRFTSEHETSATTVKAN